ncbi:GatB/YqeY domain-containing protein [Qingshengfaniella alkalisoli]|uniref:GatB/YqeY domain-containing protein n=1 Tax=Qingshengfaniella alkalisoli TaxID=2599296 RepID=A0A5B8IX20_9RHOB|nr:GatB/YqeY domain-containing protein [Qingshengfaniella alkalisoli]QDY69108.1 GatB/YqeY domain-containing protein [Qingshengfaniella alkalisoli]
MGLRQRISADLKTAMKEKDTKRLSTLRLINAAIKDMEIAKRSGEEGEATGLDDSEIIAILSKMVKQRQESARAYEEGGRLELAEQERAEITILEGFLPRQLNEKERTKAIDSAIAEIGASSIRDMGKVMGALKTKYAGQMDFAKVGPEVRQRLG